MDDCIIGMLVLGPFLKMLRKKLKNDNETFQLLRIQSKIVVLKWCFLLIILVRTSQ